MGTDTNELKQGIDRTRGQLGRDVDALADKVTPGKIAERRVESIKTATTGLRDKVMGSAEGVADSTGDAVTTAADAVKRSGLGAVRTAEGNPLATGLLVFAASWLASSLVPLSEREKELGGAVREAARKSGIIDQATEMAGQVKDGMADQVLDSVEQVKKTATESANVVADEAKDHMPAAAGSSAQGG